MAIVTRDPFARTEIHRQLCNVGSQKTCDWCGQKRHYRGQPTNKLFGFWIEHDAGRKDDLKGYFCSNSCFRCYHEID